MPLALLCAADFARAQQEFFYKCVDANGVTFFANTGSSKGCTKITLDPAPSHNKSSAPKAKKKNEIRKKPVRDLPGHTVTI